MTIIITIATTDQNVRRRVSHNVSNDTYQYFLLFYESYDVTIPTSHGSWYTTSTYP